VAKSVAGMIIHPLLASALVSEFDKSKDKSLLERAKGELVEAITHTDHTT
jgi:hypothetical protein